MIQKSILFTALLLALSTVKSQNTKLDYDYSNAMDLNKNYNGISTEKTQGLDLSLLRLDMPSSILKGNTPVVLTVKNTGTQNIHSFDVKWRTDNGVENTQNISGVNIAPGQEFTFAHNKSWNAPSGQHNFYSEISNVNGNTTDNNSSNNILPLQIKVATNSVQRIVMYEEFTSSTCFPCYTYNKAVFDPFFNGLDPNLFSLVKNQVSFPAPGDPYWNPDVNIRRDWYGVNAVPSVYRESIRTAYTKAELIQEFNAAVTVPAFFDIVPDFEMDGSSINISVEVKPYMTGDYKLLVAVVERETTGNVANNGETEFAQVMMKMFPDGDGTAVSLVADQNQTFSFGPFDMSSTHVEELDDLQVVVWLQDPDTLEVMQSGHTNYILGTDSVSENQEISIYPNPAHGFINVNSKNPVDISITNTAGQRLISLQNVSKDKKIDISMLPAGVYLVSIKENSKIITKNLIVR